MIPFSPRDTMEMPVPVHSSTPYSADSEGLALREYMDAQAREQRGTRISQDVSAANENAFAHNEPIAQSPRSGRTQNFTEPQIRESGSVPRVPTSTIPFPTINIDPATPQGSIQEPGIGPQGQQNQLERYSQGPSSIREAVQDPGPSNQHSRGSQYHQSRQEPALEPATDAQEPHQSLYSGDYESQILRDFVDAQEQLSPESRLRNPYERRTSESSRGEAHPRSSRASQKSRAVIGDVADPGPSRRRSRQHSRSRNEFTISGATTTEEVIRQLVEKKRETRTLRRALRLAAERMNAENQRIVALERGNARTIEHFLTLNESKMDAEQEALKAGSELRVYQFQLEDARKEIERAQDMVRMLENQRNEAEEAASRSRAEVRKHAQAHMIAAAKEEGRRLGFEAGLRRAEEEAVFLDLRSRRRPGSRAHEVTALPPDFDLEHVMSSPVRRRTLRAQAPSTHREASPPPPQPLVQVQPPTPPGPSVNEEVQPRASGPAPDITRSASPGPSLLRYPVYIPSASEIEQQNTQAQQLGESSQPWVTAREYHQITGTQPSPENINQASFPNPSSNVVTFAPTSLQSSHKKKESWLRRTLTRPWRKASRVVPDAEETPSSANPPPGVRVRGDFAPRTHETHADRASMSTHLSQFELVNPPLLDAPGPSYRNPDESTPSLAGSAPKGKRRVRERTTPLHVMNEDPFNTNEASAPLSRDIPPLSPSMGQIREFLGDARSSYSDPRAVEEWRRLSASPSIVTAIEMSQSRPARPPSVTSRKSGPPRRRPAHLTVPPLLAPQATNPPSSTVPGSSSQNPAFLGVGDMRPSLQRNPTSGTVYGITVEPPSCSPTEAPHSARPLQENLLSPNLAYATSLRSVVQSIRNNGGSSSVRNSATPLIFSPSRVSGYSQAPPVQSNSPKTQASSRSLAPTDHLRPSSVTSHATTHAPPRSATDNASVRSGPRSVHGGRNIPQQYPASVNPNPTSHRRNTSDSTYPAPNGHPPGGNANANGAHDLHRVASNQSMNSVRSANSQYARYDPNTYVEPTALYQPVSVGLNRQGDRQRTMSNVSGTTLSYIS